MTGSISSHANSDNTLPIVASNPSIPQAGASLEKDVKKSPNRLTQLFYSILPLKARQTLIAPPRADAPSNLEDSRDRAPDIADLASLVRELEEIEAFCKTKPQTSSSAKIQITKNTCLKNEQISLAEKTLALGLFSRNEGKVFDLACLVTDYTVLSYTVFYPECSVVNLECCFQLTSLTLEYVARLSNLEVLDLSRCFPEENASFWRPANDESLDKKPSLLAPLAKCSNLHTLKLSRCFGLKDEDLQDLPSLKQLKCLDLSYCSHLTAKSVELIAQLPRLEKLQLVRCEQLEWEQKALLDMCSKCTTLEEIDLTGVDVYPSFASKLVSKMPSVKKGIILGGEYAPINTFRRIEERSS